MVSVAALATVTLEQMYGLSAAEKIVLEVIEAGHAASNMRLSSCSMNNRRNTRCLTDLRE